MGHAWRRAVHRPPVPPPSRAGRTDDIIPSRLSRTKYRIAVLDCRTYGVSSTKSPLRPNAGTVRRHEIQRLVTSLDRLPRQRGMVIEVAGGIGSGKSRLLAEFAAEAHERDIPVLHARGTAYGQNNAFHVVVAALHSELVSQRLDHLPTHTAASLRRVLHAPTHLDAADPDAGPAQVGSHRLRLLLRHVTHDGLVIILDDMHWADPQSLALIDQLISSPLDVPLLVVMADRPRQAPPQLRESLAHGLVQGTVERIALPALTREQCAELLGMGVEDPRLRDLCRESEGNPLYLLAAAHCGDRGTHGPTAHPPSPVPAGHVDDLQNQYAAHLLAEISGLSGVEAQVLHAAAVFAERFDLVAVAAVAELDMRQVCAATDRLVRRDLLRVVDAGVQYSFRHPILRRLAYTESDACRRLRLHRNALAVLVERDAPAAARAPHIEHSFTGENARDAVATLVRAADEVMRSAPRQAGQWLRLAGSLIDRDPGVRDQRTTVLAKTAHALFLEGRPAESRALLEAALAIRSGEGVEDRVRLIKQRTMIDLFLGNHTQAWASLTSEIAALPQPRSATGILFVLRTVMGVVGSGMWPSSEELRTTLRSAGSGPDGDLEGSALALYGLYEVIAGDRAAGARMIDRCATRLDQIPNDALVDGLEVLPLLAWAEIFLGRFTDAQRHMLRGLGIAYATGQVYLLPIMIDGLCHICLFVGPTAGAEPIIDEAYAIAERIDSDEVRGLTLALKALQTSWNGAHDTGRQLAEQAVAALQPGSLWRVSAALALARATVVADPRRSRMLILDVGRGPDLLNLPAMLRPMCHRMLTVATIAAGDPDAALWAKRARDAVRESELSFQHAEALLAEAEVARFADDPDTASDLYQHAADRLAAADLTLPRTTALLDAAECEAVAGRVDDATKLLVLARELARRSGADTLYRRAEERLAALAWAKGSTEPGAATALSVLTNREREIADLAGTGMRTREIAQVLRLSPRTVDAHLAHIYRKLDLSSRAELAHLVTGLQSGPAPPSSALGLSKCGP
ncbi:ATP-binding protein [Embleya sp. NPDC059237]|uniref:ATP-binding protein n=1 Tax=Embleya sp. NPDC059237 TaxID=3346784 RepID=UPI00369C27DB